MARRVDKIKSCVVLNPPMTEKEQEEYDKRFAVALALGLYRTLGKKEFDALVNSLKDLEKEYV